MLKYFDSLIVLGILGLFVFGIAMIPGIVYGKHNINFLMGWSSSIFTIAVSLVIESLL